VGSGRFLRWRYRALLFLDENATLLPKVPSHKTSCCLDNVLVVTAQIDPMDNAIALLLLLFSVVQARDWI